MCAATYAAVDISENVTISVDFSSLAGNPDLSQLANNNSTKRLIPHEN